MKIYREITPLKNSDVFVIAHYDDPTFEYPIHNHPEYEICLTLNSKGTRIVGDSITKYFEKDLVLIGPYVYHRWDDVDHPIEKRKDATVVVLQFDEQLFDTNLLDKEAFYSIKQMLFRSTRGIQFEGPNFDQIAQRLINLAGMSGFEATLEFLSILNNLASTIDQKLLTSTGFNIKPQELGSTRINDVYDFIMDNYTQKISLNQAAEIANMSESAFSHFFKKCTNKSFTQFIVEQRIGLACNLLMKTQDTISEICFQCGFNNISNFNRLFKKYKKATPLQYRKNLEMSLFSTDAFRGRYVEDT